MQKITKAKISAYAKETYSLVPKYLDGEKPKSERVFAKTPDRTKAARAFMPMALNGMKPFAQPLMSITHARQPRTSIAQPPA